MSKLERSSDFEEMLESLKAKYASTVEHLRSQGMVAIFATVGENKEGQWGLFRNVYFNKGGETYQLKFKGLKIPSEWHKGVYLVSYPKDVTQEVSEREYNGKVYKTLTVKADLDEVDFMECEQDKGSKLVPVEDDGLPF